MLMIAEGTVHEQIADDELQAVHAWFGPMIDAGFLHSGYVDVPGKRLWMILSCPSVTEANQRLDDLPIVRDHSVSFATTAVTGLRFT
jgi:hypothetical protein